MTAERLRNPLLKFNPQSHLEAAIVSHSTGNPSDGWRPQWQHWEIPKAGALNMLYISNGTEHSTLRGSACFLTKDASKLTWPGEYSTPRATLP